MFFALWPDAGLQRALAAATHDVVLASRGRAVPPENLHITLAFLGSVPEADIGQVSATAVQVAGHARWAPLRMTLDTIEYWKKAELLCVTAGMPSSATPKSVDRPGAALAEPPAAMLAEALKSHLTVAGFKPDLKPFRPHVTLARKVVRAGRSAALHPVHWQFEQFALVESETNPAGAVYRVLESFPLCRSSAQLM